MDKVAIYHPDMEETKDQPVTVPRESYDRVWKNKGWRIHPPREKKEKE
jgi:hypothetical protein